MKNFKVKDPIFHESGWVYKNEDEQVILDNEFNLYKSGTKLVLNNDNYTINYRKTLSLNFGLSEEELDEKCKLSVKKARLVTWDIYVPFNDDKDAGGFVGKLNFKDSNNSWYIWDNNAGLVWMQAEDKFTSVADARRAAIEFVKKNAKAYIDDNGEISLKWN